MPADVVVVGAGLFGSVVAAALRAEGADVLVVDDRRPGAGSPPAGCVVRPSWLSSMTPQERTDALELLARLYELREEAFTVWGSPRPVACFRVEPSEVLRDPDVVGRVAEVSDNGVVLDTEYCYTARLGVVLACGVWGWELAGWCPPLSPRWGVSFRGAPTGDPALIRMWAPFKQVVSFELGEGRRWVGDGTALKTVDGPPDRVLQCMNRCRDLGGLRPPNLEAREGLRPYAEGKLAGPCVLERRGRVWCATGGGKNGTAAAAWAARRIVREVLG